MKIFGHPVHLMLIHFPSALLPMDLACSAACYYTGEPSFGMASFYAMCGAVVLGWAAVAAGAFDLIAVSEQKPTALQKALVHGSVNTAVIIAYSLLAYRAYRQYPLLIPDCISLLIVKALCIGFMIIGNFIGGALILKHHVAVENE